MVRGCQKKIILLKNTGSPIFEEAYFILSDMADNLMLGESDMIKEAKRIIDEGHINKSGPKKEKKRTAFNSFIWFISGALFSGGLITALGIIF